MLSNTELAQLELAVGRAVHRARAAERALHERRDDWTMEVGGLEVPCDRQLCPPDRIVFTGTRPHRAAPGALMVLRCGADIVDLAELDADTPEGYARLRHEILVAA